MKIKYLFVVAILSMLLCGAAQAADFEARGSAIVPGLQMHSSSSSVLSYSVIRVTNTSGSDVSCRVSVYDHNGADVSSLCSVITGNSSAASATTLSTGTGLFSLPAGHSRYIWIYKSNWNKVMYGHAVIEWDSEDTSARKALVVSGERYINYGTKAISVMLPVIGAQPF
ncbi:MAG: hypothetical protein OCC46_13520 [Pseudodesulfovibrio sp.]